MEPADAYRIKAAELTALAKRATDTKRRAEYEKLAAGYLHLATQADRNARADLSYEPPPLRAADPQAERGENT